MDAGKRKQLSFAGVLDPTTAIDQAITTNGNDAALHAALADPATARQKAVAPFFAEYPELHPLYTAYMTPPAPCALPCVMARKAAAPPDHRASPPVLSPIAAIRVLPSLPITPYSEVP